MLRAASTRCPGIQWRSLRTLAAGGRLVHWRSTPNPRAQELIFPAGRKLFLRSDAVLRLQATSPVSTSEALRMVSPPLAELMQIDAISEVLLGHDRITINLEPGFKFDDFSLRISEVVCEAIEQPMSEAGLARLSALTGTTHSTADASWDDGSVESEIVEVLELHIRPYVREDGGDLRFIGFDHERGAAQVQLVGACSGCPSSAKTLQGRVEQLLRHFVPEVRLVEPVSDEEAAAILSSSRGEAGEGAADACDRQDKVALEEHISRLIAEGEATSIVWEDVQSQRRERPTTGV